MASELPAIKEPDAGDGLYSAVQPADIDEKDATVNEYVPLNEVKEIEDDVEYAFDPM